MTTVITYKGIGTEMHTHNDHIGRVIKNSKSFYERTLLQYIDEHVPHGGIYIDCGANIGNHTVFFATHCAAKVISIEPVTENFIVLRQNVRENRLTDKVSPMLCAASDKPGIRYGIEKVPENMGMCRMTDGRDIESTTIDGLTDSIPEGTLHLLKIDCEGMEMNVLRGAVETIEKHKPFIIVEAATKEEQDAVHAFLGQFGYERSIQFNATPTFVFAPKSTYNGQVIASLASMACREKALEQTIYSIIDQVDHIYVYLNDYLKVPTFLYTDKITVMEADHSYGDIGDVGKFAIPEDFSGYHLTLDDDIIYDKNYVRTMIAGIEKYNRKAVVTMHGRTFSHQPMASYYRAAAQYYRCLDKVQMDAPVHVPGSGCMAYHTDTIRFGLEIFEHSNMSDIYAGIHCQRKQVPCICLAHPAGFLMDSDMYDASQSIFVSCRNSDIQQTKAANSIIWKLF